MAEEHLLNQREFEKLPIEEMIAYANKSIGQTGSKEKFQKATGLNFSYSTLCNILRSKGYCRIFD